MRIQRYKERSVDGTSNTKLGKHVSKQHSSIVPNDVKEEVIEERQQLIEEIEE